MFVAAGEAYVRIAVLGAVRQAAAKAGRINPEDIILKRLRRCRSDLEVVTRDVGLGVDSPVTSWELGALFHHEVSKARRMQIVTRPVWD